MRDHVAALIKRVLEQDAEIQRLEAEVKTLSEYNTLTQEDRK